MSENIQEEVKLEYVKAMLKLSKNSDVTGDTYIQLPKPLLFTIHISLVFSYLVFCAGQLTRKRSLFWLMILEPKMSKSLVLMGS